MLCGLEVVVWWVFFRIKIPNQPSFFVLGCGLGYGKKLQETGNISLAEMKKMKQNSREDESRNDVETKICYKEHK